MKKLLLALALMISAPAFAQYQLSTVVPHCDAPWNAQMPAYNAAFMSQQFATAISISDSRQAAYYACLNAALEVRRAAMMGGTAVSAATAASAAAKIATTTLNSWPQVQ